MPVQPLVTPAFIGPADGGGLVGSLGDAVGAGGVAAIGAGLVGLGAAAVVIPLLAAPAGGALAIGGVAAGGVFAVGAFLEVLQQLQRWNLINYRPAPTVQGPAPGTQLIAYPAGNGPFTILYDRTTFTSVTTSCDPPGLTVESAQRTTVANSLSVFAKGMEIGATSGTGATICGTTGGQAATQQPAISTVFAAGGGQLLVSVPNGQVFPSSFFNRQNTFGETLSNIRIQVGGTVIAADRLVPSPESVPRQKARILTVPDAPVLPAPGPVPATPVLPPPPGDQRPLAPPVTIPRPGQDPARVPVPGPSTTPRPGPGPAPVPAQPAPQPFPAVGPLPAPRPLPVPVTPGEVVVVDGQPISGPGQAPAPNLTAIAQELGRLERKSEILLRRPENGGGGALGEASVLAVLRGLLQDLVNELLNDVPGGVFELNHACPPTGGAETLPPVEVPYSGGGNPTAGILAKLDGLAGLIQAHKDMGQPTCRTPRFGQEVTVNFESDG